MTPADRRIRAALSTLVFTLGLGLRAGATEPDPVPTIGVEELTRGMKGYGLSVFAGTEPERFEVEMLGLLRNQTPGTDFIMARLTGQGLEQAGVSSGMSGSPVYFDGRLAGAVAFSWNFSRGAIAGITTIAEMRKLRHQNGGVVIASPPAGQAVSFAELARQSWPESFLEQRLASLRSPSPAGATTALAWLSAGFGSQTSGLLERTLGAISMSGQAPPGPGGTALQAGGMIGAVIVDGDLRLAATGTVTDRIGDELLAFGHQFLGAGPMAVPLSTAEVVTVIDSVNSSFKLSNVGEIVGTWVDDRRAGIYGRIGPLPKMMPLTVTVVAEGERRYQMRLADVPRFTSSMIATSLLGALEANAWRSGQLGVDLEATFELEGHSDVTVRQSFAGEGAAGQAASYILGVSSFLFDNEIEKVVAERIDLRVSPLAESRPMALLAATPERTVVAPGERLRLYLDFLSYRGEPQEETLEVELPATLQAGRVTILVGDGASIDGARATLEPAEPRTVEEGIALLARLHSRRQLVALVVTPDRGMVVAGKPLPRLPGSVRSWLANTATAATTPTLRSAVVGEAEKDLRRTAGGLLRLDLRVEKPSTDRPETKGKGKP